MNYSHSHRCQQPTLPCFHCHPTTYIRLVQHLIERCLLLQMDRDECIRALAKHVCIHPIITLTVWRGLQRENTEFFQAYFHTPSPGLQRENTEFFQAYFHTPSPRAFMRCMPKAPRFGRKNHLRR